MNRPSKLANLPFDPKLSIRPGQNNLSFEFGDGVFCFGKTESRRLQDIRKSLLDTQCAGPDPVYLISMGVGRSEHEEELKKRNLLFGVVLYAAGRLGQEPVRSQGHVHVISPNCGWSAPELIEVWQGAAIVYLQRHLADDPGCCIAITAYPGERVVIPPGWAHCVINADEHSTMMFGALCNVEYGFEYEQVRARGGLAWFPLLGEAGTVTWQKNPGYGPCQFSSRRARQYPELGVAPDMPIYEQFAQSPDRLQWVSEPQRLNNLWEQFTP